MGNSVVSKCKPTAGCFLETQDQIVCGLIIIIIITCIIIISSLLLFS